MDNQQIVETIEAIIKSFADTEYDTTNWKRTQPNENLMAATVKPFMELLGKEFTKEDFEAADKLASRRFQAYMELVPFSEWPTE